MKQQWRQDTQYNDWDSPGHSRAGDLKNVNWGKEYWSLAHPVRAISKDGQYLIDYDTGEIIGVLAEGYRFYLAHDHIHVCKKDWDFKSYPNGWPEDPVKEF